MKKLSIVLIDESGQESQEEYMPGDIIAGYLNFSTNASLKYTCAKIRFIGVVTTKIAKESGETYVLNEQVVLLGDPTNSEDFVLPEGKHSWPFEFHIPNNYIPSSGKYRHGQVKYSLSGTIHTKNFFGSMHETKANQVLKIKDLINCASQEYSTSVSYKGSSNIKPDTNKIKNLATANVQLSRSAFMKSQTLNLNISLGYPRKLQRDPGCWVQLVRKEIYSAGDERKDYSHVVANSTCGFKIHPETDIGNILTDLIIPENAIPTMKTTKMISIEYFINVLLDMRPKLGFMERSRRNINKKFRTKLIESPGGIEIEFPVTIGTLFDAQHKCKSSPFTLGTIRSDLTGMSTNAGSIASISAAASKLSLSVVSSNTASPVLEASSSSSPRLGAPNSAMVNPDPRVGYATMPANYPRQGSEPNYHSMAPTNGLASRSRTLSGQPSVHSSLNSKPLPSLPNLFTRSHPSAPMLSELSTSPESTIPRTTQPFQPPPFISTVPTNLLPPPFSNGENTDSPERRLALGPSGYPREKAAFPEHRHQHIQPPLALQFPSPTAPQAVDLGMGPASPGELHKRFSQLTNNQGKIVRPNDTPAQEYFQYQPQGSHSSQSQSSYANEQAVTRRNPQQWPSPNSSQEIRNDDLQTSAPPYTHSYQASGNDHFNNKY
ncbi:hypothetical protein BGZ76_009074 [Entomortierella beljakovae]|nr:hypothetical protein BGZ76_009074 [Entomortierella beljakovae]